MLPGLLVALMLCFVEVSGVPGAVVLPYLTDVAIPWNLPLFPSAGKKGG